MIGELLPILAEFESVVEGEYSDENQEIMIHASLPSLAL